MGILLNPSASGSADCCCGGTTVTCCKPCRVPDRDLQIVYSFRYILDHQDIGAPSTSTSIGSQTVTLAYATTGTPDQYWLKSWTGMVTCPDGVDRQVQLTCLQDDPLNPPLGGHLQLTGPPTAKYFLPGTPVNMVPWSGGGGAGMVGPTHNDFANYGTPDNPSSGRYTCQPVLKRDNAGYSGFYDSTPVNGGYRELTDPTPGTYGGTCCSVRVHVRGCDAQSLANASVTIRQGGTTKATGTTDGTGNVDRELDAGSYDVDISAARFVATTFTAQSLTCNGTRNVDMSGHVAGGYHCITGCAIPLPETLHATWSAAGAQTFTWSGTSWQSSFTIATHAYVVTVTTSMTCTITRDGASCGTVDLSVFSCPTAFSATITPPAGVCLTELGTASLTE